MSKLWWQCYSQKKMFSGGVLALTLGLFLGCGSPALQTQEGSGLSGKVSSFREILPDIAKPRPQAVIDQAVAKMTASGRRTATPTNGLGKRQRLHAVLAESLVQVGAIPPDQLHHLLYDLMDPASTACGGVSCSRVFGIKTQDINREMDELLQAVKTSKTLADPVNAGKKRAITASLERPRLPVGRNQVLGWGIPNAGASWSLSGTCIGGSLVSYGLRTLGQFQPLSENLNHLKNSMDYRNTLPKKFQGATGSCHLFSTIELFRHSLIPALKAVKNIDIGRTFAEIWSLNLGKSLSQAVENELDVIRILDVGRAHTMRTARSLGLSEDEAFIRFVKESSVHIRYHAQAGNGIEDFSYLKEHGAVLEDAPLRPVTMADLEKLGEQLAMARLGILQKAAAKGAVKITDEEMRAAVRPILQKIFAIAEESLSAPRRSVIARELENFEIIGKTFDAHKGDESIQRLLKDFQTFGPLYVGTEHHASLLVGYNSWRRKFLIRDSDDRLQRPYIEVNADEFFNTLKMYLYIKPTAKSTAH
jgi:hypothetical protein